MPEHSKRSFSPAAALRVGDRVLRSSYRPATFEVTGWTPRGKVILRNIETGSETKGWWPTWASLPPHYELDEARHNDLVDAAEQGSG